MNYVTVFDAGQKGLDWAAPVFGTLFVIVGVHTLVTKRSTPPYDRPFWRVATGLFILFGLAIAVGIPVTYLLERRALISALESGQVTAVEGRVQDFVPMPWEGHAMECFTVEKTRICYSDFVVTPGFNNARSHGGPINEGLHVRILHVNRTIARLEIGTEQR